MERSKSRLKDRLARVFRGSSLLRSACAPSSNASNGGRSLLDDVAHQPVFVPGRRQNLLHDHLQQRSLSFQAYSDSHRVPSAAIAAASGRLSVDCNDCRPSRASNLMKKATHLRLKCNEKKNTKKKLLSNPYGFTSSSSVESDDEFGFFSGNEKEVETDTLFSSKSFSSDSSSFYQRPSSNKKKTKKKKSQKKSHGGFRPVVSMKSSGDHKGKTKMADVNDQEDNDRIFPVVMKAVDPYADFQSSMVEMIVERQIFSAKQLEQLLHSYLSLNSHHHHPAIIQAFSDICDVLFAC